jgi:hypothetical protein
MSPRGAFGAQIVTLRNVSTNGAMGEATKPPAVGEAVTLKIGPTTTIFAVVVWKAQDRFGLEFDREVDPSEYAEF